MNSPDAISRAADSAVSQLIEKKVLDKRSEFSIIFRLEVIK